MAKLEFEVRLGAGVCGYSLFVDGIPAAMDSDHRGQAECGGRCGDGSTHSLLYTFSGLPGATLAITVRCSARIVCGLSAEIAAAAGRPWRAGRELFAL
jgi:hypothetical protein